MVEARCRDYEYGEADEKREHYLQPLTHGRNLFKKARQELVESHDKAERDSTG
jgi:hypothetical protein